ncbi:acetyl-CoA acetyltransferase [Aeromonas phage vB_AspA_Tola]|nr:acetyl-CoA acetyltransferase [Aeromonas phage vB_AspA_Tola]
MTRVITGDAPKSYNTKAVVSPFPVVTQAQLAEADDVINIYTHSGKEIGTVVMVTMTVGGACAMAIAQGNSPTSKWNIVGDTAGTPITSVTPA